MTLGTGVGGGIIADGRLLTGANDAAGEIGHTAIFADGLLCACGHRGCVERYVGARYVEDRARKRVRAQRPASSCACGITGPNPCRWKPRWSCRQ
ncbi:MAG: ROK family protein, partial [Bryobacteraceae bacterium]